MASAPPLPLTQVAMARLPTSWSPQPRPITTSLAAPAAPMGARIWRPWVGIPPHSSRLPLQARARIATSIQTRTTEIPTTTCIIPPTTTSDALTALSLITMATLSRGCPRICGLLPCNKGSRRWRRRGYKMCISIIPSCKFQRLIKTVFGAIPLFSRPNLPYLFSMFPSSMMRTTGSVCRCFSYTRHAVFFFSFSGLSHLSPISSLGQVSSLVSTLLCNLFQAEGRHLPDGENQHYGGLGVGRASFIGQGVEGSG